MRFGCSRLFTRAASRTKSYSYDNTGNLLTFHNGSISHSYTYGDSDWGDLLTGWNGKTITSDTIGNMLSDGTWSYTWEHGRELTSMTGSGTTWSFTYNADGLRTKRTNGSTTYSYVYNGSSLSQMTVGSNTLYFAYDASGTPLSVTYNGTNYYYATNLQGDVTAILNTSGTAVVQYTYDAWGKLLTTTGSMASTLGVHNPLRYRGYVYDAETGLYYLQSRYYNPAMGRFINADALISSGQVILGNNMFAYCQNNPVNKVDPNGEAPILLALLVIATTFVAISTGVNFMVNVVNKDKIDKEIEDTYTQDKAKQEIDQILSKYSTDSPSYVTFKDDNAEITGSSNVTSRYDRQKISMIITRTDGLTERSTGNLSAEWAGHNAAVIIPRYREQALNVNLDYTRDSRPWIRYATKALEIMGWE